MDQSPTESEDHAWVLRAVSFLDRVSDDRPEVLALNLRVSATLCVAFAPTWVNLWPGSAHTVGATAEAARAFLELPGPETHLAWFRAASASYSFGPGEGCYSIASLGAGCGPGTGCRTGIGWVESLLSRQQATAVRRCMESVMGTAWDVEGPA